MFKNKTHSVEDRIVSIHQPHVRPIVRGKDKANTEFGAKLNLSLVDGYSFIDHLKWDAYNEGVLLKESILMYLNATDIFQRRCLLINCIAIERIENYCRNGAYAY